MIELLTNIIRVKPGSQINRANISFPPLEFEMMGGVVFARLLNAPHDSRRDHRKRRRRQQSNVRPFEQACIDDRIRIIQLEERPRKML